MAYDPPYLGPRPKPKAKTPAGSFKFKKSKSANDSKFYSPPMAPSKEKRQETINALRGIKSMKNARARKMGK